MTLLYISLKDYYEIIKESIDFSKYVIVGTITYHDIGDREDVPVFDEFNPYHFADWYIVYVPPSK